MKPMTIRFPEDLYEKVKEVAEDKGYTMAEYVRKIVKDSIENTYVYPEWGTLDGE